MSTITTLNDGITGASFRGTTNTNFSNLNTDKAELSGATFTGDIIVPAEVYGVGWNGSNEAPTKNDIYDKIETLGSGSVATDAIWDAKGDLAVGTGANTASRLAVGTNGQVLTADSAEVTGLKWSNPAGGGDALTSGTLAQFAATTSLQLKGVMSDETGSGSLVFANSPTLVTPVLGVATANSINGASIISGTLDGSVTGTNTGDNATNTQYASDYRAANFVAGTNYVAPNAAITGATKTKIIYDAKGLVTSGADATTADIADSLNKRYVTDTNLTTIGNQSGTNTGNQTITNTSDGTSHTATLSATGGSIKLVEGANITLTTTGTGADGIVTIASTAGGTGDVVGPASATDNAIARYDTTTGKLIQNSGVTIGDTNIISGVDTLNVAQINSTAQNDFSYNFSDTILSGGGFTFYGATHRRINDGGSNEYIKFPTSDVGGAINEFTISNAATGNGPILEGTGGDTNIDININPKGTGRIKSGTVAVPTISSTDTLTNKRVTKRVVVTTQSATPSINTDNGDIFQITGLAQAITSMTTNLTGTPVAGDMMMIQITDNATARAITWGASFASTTVTLPTTTVISTMLRVGFQRNNANTVWDCIAVA